jgi:hypothetical protein
MKQITPQTSQLEKRYGYFHLKKQQVFSLKQSTPLINRKHLIKGTSKNRV